MHVSGPQVHEVAVPRTTPQETVMPKRNQLRIEEHLQR